MELTLPTGTPAIRATGSTPGDGLVVIPDIWGLRPLYDEMVDDLAQRTGRTVVAFEPFPGRELPGAADADAMAARSAALRELDDATMMADALAAAELTGATRVALIGFCMGGMYALKASHLGRFDRIVSFYGMIRVPQYWVGPGQGQPLESVAERGDTEIMTIVGTVDAFTPAEDVDALEAHGVEAVRYEGADHGFVHDPSPPPHPADDAADAGSRVHAVNDT